MSNSKKESRVSRVAVLGCGPAGLLAAYAADRFGGAEVSIFSKKRKSEMFGAQYLHTHIPGIPLPEPVDIKYQLQGTIEGYREKVYGSTWAGGVSPGDLESEHKAWDIRAAYNWLWDMYQPAIQDGIIDVRKNAARFTQAIGEVDLMISSIPRSQMCMRPELHKFHSQTVWSIGDAPERGVFAPVPIESDNTVICNGEPDVGWYRASKVYGYKTVEWPEKRKPPYEGVAEVTKPLYTDCDCWPQVTFVGRYGKWNKSVLSHTAFDEVLAEMIA